MRLLKNLKKLDFFIKNAKFQFFDKKCGIIVHWHG